MGIKYLWDTNTVIYYLQQQFTPQAELYIDDLISEVRPIISTITEIELLCWKSASESDLKLLHEFIRHAVVIELEQQIKIKTADIRKMHNLKLPDAIIAATASVYGLTIITRNVADFKRVPELKVLNPWDLEF